ncbi:MAG: RnfABCDGE type electron transport complex subunit G [Ruminococcus sp.]|uniref:RnfABCDGE type electron transport complex subunit G n=1 Tax=Ruminococcus sp. TaxID=41978 RepID=UPI002872BB30|nr:RnfABCDGE type electron transport complex subunit G [Ruminococcus sp.]MBQ3286237.1 RnfABCDGE type electron transport complex subunit G [Ruminococcus sp.]
MRVKITPKAILIPTLSLFLICIVVTAALALTNNVTADKIADNELQSKNQSMKNVCPEAQTFDELIPDVLYEGKKEGGETVGYAISTASQGYGGQVKVMTGIADGEIIGVDVFYNDDETPGLGKNTSNESFCDQYKGLTTDTDIAVSKDDQSGNAQTVDAVTSATISSRAVTKAVNEACHIYNDNVGTTNSSVSLTKSEDAENKDFGSETELLKRGDE